MLRAARMPYRYRKRSCGRLASQETHFSTAAADDNFRDILGFAFGVVPDDYLKFDKVMTTSDSNVCISDLEYNILTNKMDHWQELTRLTIEKTAESQMIIFDDKKSTVNKLIKYCSGYGVSYFSIKEVTSVRRTIRHLEREVLISMSNNSRGADLRSKKDSQAIVAFTLKRMDQLI